jgi:hypothetical protein
MSPTKESEMSSIRTIFAWLAWIAACLIIGSLAGMLFGCGGGSPEDDADQHTATTLPVVCYPSGTGCAK